ncbi:hypothetical protein LOTGIDRAFT_197032 [Lottia gigantea]|uniref:Major facilitator superfamily (MFS) profile domain-containing protein n=1 Tax=Lottia gigantea TaxID=225164 RepID=V3Z025_LOTGI|nr:hypothetical protein LOTGIDRAFT_197032 [Lottia gigantea]ESO83823.1 hypothetical protein LOTGIDRAFT_197032 [Lottia gigantea]
MAAASVDRGWAWMVVLSSFFAHFFSFGVAWTTGVYNIIFLEQFGQSRLATAWASSLTPACMFFAGPFASIMINKLGCRKAMIIGGLTSSFGLITSYFAPSIHYLYVTFGVIAGFGFGLSHLSAITAVTFCFDRRRNLATGIAVTGVGLGTLTFPPLIAYLVDNYSWRGSLLIVGGMCLNLCACGALIRPISRVKRISNTTYLDTSIFKKATYWSVCANSFLICFGMSVTYIHLTAFAKDSGINLEDSTLLVSGIGVSNLVGRLILGILGQHPKINLVLLYMFSFAIAGVSVFISPFWKTFAGLLVLALIFGFCTAGIGTLFAPILAKILGLRRFTGGYGCVSMVSALGQVLGGPIAGLLFDLTGTYSATFWTGGITLLASSACMVLPLRYKSNSRINPPSIREDFLSETDGNQIVNGSPTLVYPISKRTRRMAFLKSH